LRTDYTVQFKEGLYRAETGARYKVVEINGDRAIIEFICDLPIPPQSVASVDELEVIGDREIPESNRESTVKPAK
jgi:hypothetical protein